MTKIYCDGSHQHLCYVYEGQQPVVLDLKWSEASKITGNQAEYYALISALQDAARKGMEELEMLADSQLMVRQLTPTADGKYQYTTRNHRLQQLRGIVKSLEFEFTSVTYTWIPREQNLAGIELYRVEGK